MVVLKGYPTGAPQPGQPTQTKELKGTWQADGVDYEFNLEGGTDKRTAKFEGNHLIITGEVPLAFRKED